MKPQIFKLLGICIFLFTTIHVLSHLSKDGTLDVSITKWFIVSSCFILVCVYFQTFFKILGSDSFKNHSEIYYLVLFFSILLLSIVVLFAYNFKQLYDIDTKAFYFQSEVKFSNLVDWIYFSSVTFATVGYGDAFPATTEARVLCTLEIITGIFLLIIVISNFDKFKKFFSLD